MDESNRRLLDAHRRKPRPLLTAEVIRERGPPRGPSVSARLLRSAKEQAEHDHWQQHEAGEEAAAASSEGESTPRKSQGLPFPYESAVGSGTRLLAARMAVQSMAESPRSTVRAVPIMASPLIAADVDPAAQRQRNRQRKKVSRQKKSERATSLRQEQTVARPKDRLATSAANQGQRTSQKGHARSKGRGERKSTLSRPTSASIARSTAQTTTRKREDKGAELYGPFH